MAYSPAMDDIPQRRERKVQIAGGAIDGDGLREVDEVIARHRRSDDVIVHDERCSDHRQSGRVDDDRGGPPFLLPEAALGAFPEQLRLGIARRKRVEEQRLIDRAADDLSLPVEEARGGFSGGAAAIRDRNRSWSQPLTRLGSASRANRARLRRC